MPETAIPKPETVKVHKICNVDKEEIEVHKGQQVVYENGLKDCEVWITTAGPDPYGRKLNDPISPGASTPPLTVSSNRGRYTVNVDCRPLSAATTGTSAGSSDGGRDDVRVLPKATYVIVRP